MHTYEKAALRSPTSTRKLLAEEGAGAGTEVESGGDEIECTGADVGIF